MLCKPRRKKGSIRSLNPRRLDVKFIKITFKNTLVEQSWRRSAGRVEVYREVSAGALFVYNKIAKVFKIT